MNVASVKAGLAEYPIPLVSVVIAGLSLGHIYWNWDLETTLMAERVAKYGELGDMQDNDRNARGLSRDLEQVRSLYDRIRSKALDFDSTITTQAFFAELVQMPGVKTEGLPVPQSTPIFTETKPFAVTDYAVRATAGFLPLAGFISSFATSPTRSMVVNRVQIQSGPADKPSALGCDMTFRLWGFKGAFPPVVTGAADKKVVPAAVRTNLIAAAAKALTPGVEAVAALTNPFGDTEVVAAECGGTAELETALKSLSFTIRMNVVGSPAVGIAGQMPRRVGQDFDIKVGDRTMRLRIWKIEETSFTAITSAGKKIKVPLHQ